MDLKETYKPGTWWPSALQVYAVEALRRKDSDPVGARRQALAMDLTVEALLEPSP